MKKAILLPWLLASVLMLMAIKAYAVVPWSCICEWSTSGSCPRFRVVYWVGDTKTCCIDNKLTGFPVNKLFQPCGTTVWSPAAFDDSEFKTRCNMGCVARTQLETTKPKAL